jgi:dCTP deaminase
VAVLPDFEIKRLALECNMISPFVDTKMKENGPSYGLSSAGYDCRMANTIWIAKPSATIIDIKDLDPRKIKELFDQSTGDSFILMPGMFVLVSTVEWFIIPRDIVGRCTGKSTLRRLGHINDLTPLECGWTGNLVVELNFIFPSPIKIYAGMGVAQISFDRLENPCQHDYADLGGKYQGQVGIVPSK